MTGFVIVDDAVARSFEPFALTRPIGELRAGGALIRERWQRALGVPCRGFLGAPHLAAFEEFDAPRAATGTILAGTILVNSRFAPAWLDDGMATSDPDVWTCDGRPAAIKLASRIEVAALADPAEVDRLFERTAGGGQTSLGMRGWWVHAVWDLVRHLPAMLESDARAMIPMTGVAVPASLSVLGSHPVHVEAGATIEPMVVADATDGPVLIRQRAVVQAFTRIVGPCIVGADAHVAGGRIAACSIGDRSKVHGELSCSILIGHANKGHDGFVGHSVIGRWANLGAGTITSNLKNSYGTVSLWTPGGTKDTGLQFLGALLGDHVKTGIGTRLTTGCVVGAGASVFGSRVVPKAVFPFAWGEEGSWETFALDRFLVVAERVMARRGVKLGEGARAQLTAAHAARWRA